MNTETKHAPGSDEYRKAAVDALVKDFVYRSLRDDIKRKARLMDVAEEWFAGKNSAMREFFRKDCILASGRYKALAGEADKAICAITPPLERWEPALKELRAFAIRCDRFQISARELFDTAEIIAAAGAYEGEATSLVIDAFRAHAAIAKAEGRS